jgi:hypothetical protein
MAEQIARMVMRLVFAYYYLTFWNLLHTASALDDDRLRLQILASCVEFILSSGAVYFITKVVISFIDWYLRKL